MTLIINENGLRSQISAYDVLVMKSLNRKYNFTYIKLGLILAQDLLLLQQRPQPTPWQSAIYQQQFTLSLKCAMKRQYEWMVGLR